MKTSIDGKLADDVRPKIIAVDFDGTIVEHQYPEVGNRNRYAIDTLRMLQQAGHRLILLTMRSGEYLDDAVKYCAKHGVEFWAVNENPEQHTWTQSPKVYAHIYIDDAALGCPLIDSEHGGRPMVDWLAVRQTLGLETKFYVEA